MKIMGRLKGFGFGMENRQLISIPSLSEATKSIFSTVSIRICTKVARLSGAKFLNQIHQMLSHIHIGLIDPHLIRQLFLRHLLYNNLITMT